MDTHTLRGLKNAAIITFTILVALAGMAYFIPADEVGAAVVAHTEYKSAVATTTYSTLLTTGQASTSVTVGILEAHAVDFNVCAVASSTLGVLKYKVSYAMGDPLTAEASSTLTFFQETVQSASSTAAGIYTMTPAEHYLALTTTATCFNLPQTPVGAKWLKLDMGAQGTTSTIWYSVVPKGEI